MIKPGMFDILDRKTNKIIAPREINENNIKKTGSIKTQIPKIPNICAQV